MNSHAECVGAFRTAGRALVTVRVAVGDSQFTAECDGCGWTRTTADVARAGRGVIGLPADPLDALKNDANRHALGCAEIPRSQWPDNDT